MEGYRKSETAYSFFDAGFLIGIGSLIYANLIWFSVLLIIGIILIGTRTLKEIIISLTGLVTPFILTFGIYYLLGEDLDSLFLLLKNNLFFSSEGSQFSRLTVVSLVFVGLITSVSIAFLIMRMNTKKIKSRKTFILMIWVFLVSLGVYFIMPSVSEEIIWLASIPISYFLAHFFVFNKRKMVSEILFSVLFVLILFIQFWTLQ